ncbi:MAG: hypothetical protein HQL36_02370 [Alphaproteobacteria bacterium]|nr:hypothetical protein [Alphaproteobacteria bacterium]MBF0249292.1 hypothetical protein [Alphaproteobacteria bacterium]
MAMTLSISELMRLMVVSWIWRNCVSNPKRKLPWATCDRMVPSFAP